MYLLRIITILTRINKHSGAGGGNKEHDPERKEKISYTIFIK